jgi:hypothetical protein
LTPFEFGGDEIALEIPSRKKGNQTNNILRGRDLIYIYITTAILPPWMHRCDSEVVMPSGREWGVKIKISYIQVNKHFSIGTGK